MYNAPAVSFPVVRSYFLASLLGVIWAIGTAALVLVAAMPHQPHWLLGVAITLCAVVGLLALAQWRKSPIGLLRWDRQVWTFTPAQAATDAAVALQAISVALDLQKLVLVSFRLPTGQRLWLWLESGSDKRLWRVLRRALYAWPRDKAADLAKRTRPVEKLPA